MTGLSQIPLKEEDGWVDIGAVVRLAPIKDIKTMIYAFYELSSRMEHVRLHILGGVDDEEYAEECYALVKQLDLKNLIFTGRVDILQYMEKLDFTILDEYIGRTAVVCVGIICSKTPLCDYRCRMLQGTSEW